MNKKETILQIIDIILFGSSVGMAWFCVTVKTIPSVLLSGALTFWILGTLLKNIINDKEW